MAQDKHSYSKGDGEGIKKEEWDKVRPKSSKAKLNSVVACPVSGAHGCVRWAPKSLSNPALTVLLTAAHMASSLGQLCSLPADFLTRCSTFLKSLTSLGLYWNFSFTVTTLCITLSGTGYMTSTLSHIAGLPGLPLRFQWKLLWPHNSFTAYVCKTSTTLMIPRSSTILSGSWILLDHSCCYPWVPKALKLMNPRCPWVTMAAWVSLLNAVSSKSLFFYALNLRCVWSGQFLRCL